MVDLVSLGSQVSDAWSEEGTCRIPLLGEVAAGRPLEMFSVEDSLDVPESMWKGRKVFALRVRGQSMIDAGIHDGDYLIVEPCETADDGRTVVAEIDGHVTVKKLFREADGQVRLQPANSEMLPLRVRADGVRLRGVVVGVLRKYGFARPTAPVVRREPCDRSSRRPVPQPAPRPRIDGGGDGATLELTLNAIDSQIGRWKALLDHQQPSFDARERARFAQLGRDLQALRDWCGRTSKPTLRRALIVEANQLIRRMHRLARSRSLELPEATVH